MAGGATGEGEALDYASTVVHALAPTHGSSQVRTYFDNYLAANNIAVRAEGQAGRLNTAFTVGGAPDLESFVADQLAVTRGQANLVQAFRNLARQFGITQNAGGATLAQAVAAATITIPDAALPGLVMDAATPVANKTAVVSGLVRDGWNIAQSTTQPDGRGPRRAPRAAQQNRHLHHLHQWYSRGTPHKLNQFHNASTIRTFSKYPRWAQTTWAI